MKAEIKKSTLQGEILIPSSKSHVHRVLMATALADDVTEIYLNSWSIDIETTKECLENLGSTITHDKEKNILKVTPLKKELKANIDCRESGSTLRFFLPLVSALGVECLVTGEGRLPERPIDVLVDEMKKHGAEFESETLPLTVKGQLKGGSFTFAGNISSQYITGLMFALPLLNEDSEIILTSHLQSKSYVDMTIQVLNTFGVTITEFENGYKIKGNQKFISPKVIHAEGDWSSACFWVVAGCCVPNSNILLKGLLKNSTQGDKEIVSVMEKAGGKVTWENDGLRCIFSNISGFDVDVSQIPDAFPILSVAGALASSNSRIYNAGRVRIKESDRLKAMAHGLENLGVNLEEKEEEMIINISDNINYNKNIEISGYNDHRIVMSFVVLLSALGLDSVVTDCKAVSKSYPRFFEDFNSLGGVFNVITNR